MARAFLSGIQIPTLPKLNIDGELTLDSSAGTSGQVLTSAGAGATPTWTTVGGSYTLPTATSTVLGGIELFSDTQQSVAANSVSATASRTYGLQLNAAGQAVVNVPWTDTDTNTTYTFATGTTNGTFNVTPSGGSLTAIPIFGLGSNAYTSTAFQPQDTELTAIAGLTSAADRLPYFTGSGTASLATFTSFGRSLVDDANAAAGRTTLGLGTMATQASTSYAALAGATFTGNIAINNGTSTALTTTGATAAIFNTGATTINAFGAAATMNLGTAANAVTIGNSGTLATGSQTINLFTGTSTTGTDQTINLGTGAFGFATQTINIGTGTISSATRAVNIGSTSGTGTVTLYGAVSLPGTVSNVKIVNGGAFSFSGYSTTSGTTTLTNVPGTVGFATSTPSMLMSVLTGNATTNTGSVGAEFRASSTTTTHLITFSSGSTARGSISTNSTTTTYSTSSDYRLKENVQPITDAIDRLMMLKPSRFNFIEFPERVVDGFIAHEAQEVVPESVVGNKDDTNEDGSPAYQGIDQAKLVPLLTAALQEAISKIEQLETRIEALENN